MAHHSKDEAWEVRTDHDRESSVCKKNHACHGCISGISCDCQTFVGHEKEKLGVREKGTNMGVEEGKILSDTIR